MSNELLNFWQTVATFSVGIIITLIGFWVSIGRNIVTKQEIIEMIETQSPYLHDKQYIMERLASNKETQAALSITLQKVIEVMSELKIQIATLGKTLEALEDRMDRK